MWWFPGLSALGCHVFPCLKRRQDSKARSSRFGCQLPEVFSLIVIKFNEKALKDFNNNLIWKKTLLHQRWSIYEQEWGQRPLRRKWGRLLQKSRLETIVAEIRGIMVKQLDSSRANRTYWLVGYKV